MTAGQGARLGVVTLIWGTTWTVIRYQIAAAPAEWTVAYRYWLAGAIMLGVCLWSGKRVSLDGAGHRLALLLGVFQFALNFNLVYAAERHVTSGLVAVVFALLIVPNAILGRIFLHRPITARFLLGSVVAIAGVGLLYRQELLRPGALGADAAYGLGLTVLALFCASIGNVLQARGPARDYPVQTLLAVSMLYGAGLNTAFALVTDGLPPMPADVTFWAGAFYLAAFASALAFLLYYRLIREIGPGEAAYSSVAVPFIALALSTILEGYKWDVDAVLGAVLATIGMGIALMPRPLARVVAA